MARNPLNDPKVGDILMSPDGHELTIVDVTDDSIHYRRNDVWVFPKHEWIALSSKLDKVVHAAP